jgi:mannose-6-phosphate isomerase-like protein (cupin superfamily)
MSSSIQVVNIADKMAAFSEHWSPRVAGQVNDTHIRFVKILGDFVWHHHADEDEMFLVVKGEFTLRLRDRDLKVRAGEFVIIPRGTEHMPSAEQEAEILLIEPATVVNTGNVRDARTVSQLQQI